MLSINATALVVFAVVWILVLILTRIFFKPILRILDERAARIAKDKAAADGARQSYEDDLKRIKNGGHVPLVRVPDRRAALRPWSSPARSSSSARSSGCGYLDK